MANRLVRVGEIQYGKPMPRAAIRDGRLSFAARGLFIYLWDMPDTWRPRLSHLTKVNPKGRESVRTCMRELEQVGALRLSVEQGVSGKFRGRMWRIYAPEIWAIETPLLVPCDSSVTEERVSRHSVETIIGKPDAKEPLNNPII